MTIPPIDGTGASVPATGDVTKRRHVAVQLLKDPVAVCCLAVLLILTAVSALAPFLTDQDPIKSSLTQTLAPMGQGHLLGADGVGRDVVEGCQPCQSFGPPSAAPHAGSRRPRQSCVPPRTMRLPRGGPQPYSRGLLVRGLLTAVLACDV